MGFYLYKGLKKPLILFGLMNQYIYYGGGAAVGGIILAGVLSSIIGLWGLLLGAAAGGAAVWLTYKTQDTKGLYNKTRNNNELHIVEKTISTKQFKRN